MIYGYIRVSDESQAASGLGLAAQTAAIRDYCRRRLKGHKLAVIHKDAAISASRHPLGQRPEGRELVRAAKKDDHIVIAKVDRAFRNLADFAATMDRWQKAGVAVHLLDLGVDTSTSVGRLIAGVMAAVAEWESRRIGERIKDAKAIARGLGRSTNGRARLGFALGRGGQLKADQRERDAMRLIVRLRRRRRMIWREIAAELARRRVRTRDGRPYSKQRCWRAYHAAIALRIARE